MIEIAPLTTVFRRHPFKEATVVLCGNPRISISETGEIDLSPQLHAFRDGLQTVVDARHQNDFYKRLGVGGSANVKGTVEFALMEREIVPAVCVDHLGIFTEEKRFFDPEVNNLSATARKRTLSHLNMSHLHPSIKAVYKPTADAAQIDLSKVRVLTEDLARIDLYERIFSEASPVKIEAIANVVRARDKEKCSIACNVPENPQFRIQEIFQQFADVKERTKALKKEFVANCRGITAAIIGKLSRLGDTVIAIFQEEGERVSRFTVSYGIESAFKIFDETKNRFLTYMMLDGNGNVNFTSRFRARYFLGSKYPEDIKISASKR